jgi:hypothetical protein
MQDWAKWFEIHDLIFLGVILLLFGALGGGPLLKVLFNLTLKIFGHVTSETIVNVEQPGGEMAGKLPKECQTCGLVDPSRCTLHVSEHERSLRNKEEIASLWAFYGKLRDEMLAGQAKARDEMATGFDKVHKSLDKTQEIILGALAGTRNGFSGPGRGGGER